MRARLIYEKFTADSDPIHDLGIGVFSVHKFESTKDIAKFLVIILPAILRTNEIPEDIILHKRYLMNPKYHDKMDAYLNTYIKLYDKHLGPKDTRWDVYNELFKILLKMGYLHNGEESR
jgi:hypothetical protein